MKRGCLAALALLGAVAVVLVIVGVVGLFALDGKFGGPCGRDVAPSPRAVVRSPDIPSYEEANLAALATLTARLGQPEQAGSLLDHQCGGTAGSVVGVTTSVRYRFPAPRPMCEVVDEVETLLRADGWRVASIYTTNPAGSGFVGAATATRGAASLRISWPSSVSELVVSVDSRAGQASDGQAGGAAPPFPMACPR